MEEERQGEGPCAGKASALSSPLIPPPSRAQHRVLCGWELRWVSASSARTRWRRRNRDIAPKLQLLLMAVMLALPGFARELHEPCWELGHCIKVRGTFS